jgi:hypothetical protein
MVYNTRGQIVLKTVNELIDPISKTWDEELVRSLLMQVDAERILHIPLITQLSDDFVAWQQMKNFIFSVRSVYFIEWEHQFGHTTKRRDGQGLDQINPVWEIMCDRAKVADLSMR